jgi:hypothetical protein
LPGSLAQFTSLHWATLLLGTSPGGIAEMAITAKVLQLGVPVVTAFHVTRLAAVLLLAEPMYRWIYEKRSARRQKAHPQSKREASSIKQGPRNRLCRAAGAAAPSGGRELHEVSDRGG